uniref:Protein krueppel n=1 Tax=Anopheles farauti TaxID=69004 RepID=A0A182QF34_9DIPT
MSEQCRVCLDYTTNYLPLFVHCSDGTTLAQIIQFCADVQIAEDDDLPSHVCLKCSEDAKLAHMFVKRCRQSNNELRALYIRGNLNIDVVNKSGSNSTIQEEIQTKRELLQRIIVEASEEESEPFEIETLDEHLDEVGRHIALQDNPRDDDGFIEEYLEDSTDQDETNEENGGSPALTGWSESDSFAQAVYCCHMEKKCCDCYDTFPTIEALLEHSAKQHSIRRTVHDPARPVRCVVCFKLFRCKLTLTHHQNAPYKPRNHRCSTCGVSFRTHSQLATHATIHTTERKYVCEECDAVFKNYANLKSHTLLHSEKREVCETCGMRFHRKSNLRMHQRVHSEAYYCVCPHCDRKYKNRSQLREHMKVHTKEKPLGCRYCGKWYRYASDRKRHEMTHTGDYPFVCVCSKMYSRSRPYDRHVSKCKMAIHKNKEQEMQ